MDSLKGVEARLRDIAIAVSQGFTDDLDKDLVAVARRIESLMSQGAVEIEEPEYHYEGMGCGLEDRNITDRYEAMKYGWDEAIERMFEQIPDGPLYAALQDCEEVRKERDDYLREYENAYKENATLRAQLEAEKQGAAAMRDKLEDIARGPLQGPGDFSVYAQEVAKQALSSDAGRDYVPAEMPEKCEKDFRDLTTYSHTQDERLRKAEEELERYKRDAERYRWLRERDVDTIHKGGVFAGVTPDNLVINLEDLDAHVDRAMLNAVPEGR